MNWTGEKTVTQLTERLLFLGQLPEDWDLEGVAPKPSMEALRWAAVLIGHCAVLDFLPDTICASEKVDGGLFVMWRSGLSVAQMEYNQTHHVAEGITPTHRAFDVKLEKDATMPELKERLAQLRAGLVQAAKFEEAAREKLDLHEN